MGKAWRSDWPKMKEIYEVPHVGIKATYSDGDIFEFIVQKTSSLASCRRAAKSFSPNAVSVKRMGKICLYFIRYTGPMDNWMGKKYKGLLLHGLKENINKYAEEHSQGRQVVSIKQISAKKYKKIRTMQSKAYVKSMGIVLYPKLKRRAIKRKLVKRKMIRAKPLKRKRLKVKRKSIK